MLPPQSNKGTPHGVMPGSLDPQSNHLGQPPSSHVVGQTPKYGGLNQGGGGLGSLSYNSNQSASNGSLSILPQDPLSGKLYLPQNVDSRAHVGRDSGASHGGSHQGHQQNFSPVPQNTKRKPAPLPSPFMAKYEGSHSKLPLYSQNPIAMGKADNQAYQFSKVGSVASKRMQNDDNKTLQYNMKNHHQISQGHIPTMGQIQAQDEEMRQTFNKMMKPKISKALPPAFAGVSKGNSKKSKKHHFQEFSKMEQQKQQTNNYVINRLDTAVEAEEFKHMQNMLEPLNIDRERVAYTKIDQYNTNNPGAGVVPHHHHQMHAHLNSGSQSSKMKPKNGLQPAGSSYEHPQIDSFSKLNLIPGNAEKQHLSQSSGFSTFDTFSLRNAGQPPEPLRLDQMVTLSVFKSTSGTIKKMLHGPSLKIYCVKEVPISNREIRKVLKGWISNWERYCTSEQYIRIFDTFWNSPEGCVSVVSDFAAKGSLQNLIQSIGALPESTLKHLARSVLRATNYLHEQNMTHSNLTCSQIVFDRRGKVRLSPGFGHILKSKNETQSTLDQHVSLCQLVCGEIKNFTNKAQLIKDKFSHLVNQNNSLNQQQDQGAGIYANSIHELKKNDLFDLGIVLTICATGGLDMVNDEQLKQLADYPEHCCLIHALLAVDHQTPDFDQSLLGTIVSLKMILNRISPAAQEFICLCMQQRFTEQEMQQRRLSTMRGGVTANHLLSMHWILGQSRPGEEHSDDDLGVKLSIKELLAVSSDWNDVNNLRGGNAGSNLPGQEPLSQDFQAKQIERVVEAIAMTLPQGANHSLLGMAGGGNTLSTANLDIGNNVSDAQVGSNQSSNQLRDKDYLIKELAFDLGVDMNVLKRQLQSLYSSKF